MRINPIDPSIRHNKRPKENDDDYLAWLRRQPSAFSGRRSWPTVAAHFRTAENSGMGVKPLFQAIPLTNKEHQEQHRIGTFVFAPRSWWESQVRKHQERYIVQGGVIPKKYLIGGDNGTE